MNTEKAYESPLVNWVRGTFDDSERFEKYIETVASFNPMFEARNTWRQDNLLTPSIL
jgi:hypothetical protein